MTSLHMLPTTAMAATICAPCISACTYTLTLVHVSLRQEMIQICKHADGTHYKLGSGAHGTVYKAILDDIHVVAW